LERATWQHDIGVTAKHVVFIESPTEPLGADDVAVDFRWVPGAEGWLGLVRRDDPEAAVEWHRVDPCVVTHVLGAYDEGDGVVLYVCCYPAPEKGQPFDLEASVVGPAGVGMSLIGGGLGVLERWRVGGGRLARVQVDERFVEYPRMDGAREGAAFRYGYCVETGVGLGEAADGAGPWAGGAVDHVGLLRFDLDRSEVAAWNPGSGRIASEPLFVRAVDGRSDDEGWLLTIVDDATRGGSDLYVLDASTFGRRGPQAVVHLPDPVRLPFRSHGEWVGAELYR
jgi:carotenoid cleavage dioxygenase